MGALILFFTGPIGRWLIVAALVAAAVFATYSKVKQVGWDEREAIAVQEQRERDKAEAAALARHEARLKAYVADLDAQLAAANAKTRDLEARARALYTQLQGRLREYVTPASDARIAACGGIPVGFVLHHDASVQGEAAGPLPPASQGGELDRDSGVALSEISSVNAFNHQQFRRCITALKGWEAWYPTVKGVYQKRLTPEPDQSQQPAALIERE